MLDESDFRRISQLERELRCDYIFYPDTVSQIECEKCRGLGKFIGYRRKKGPFPAMPRMDNPEKETVLWDAKRGGGWSLFEIIAFVCPNCQGSGHKFVKSDWSDYSQKVQEKTQEVLEYWSNK